MILEMFGSRGGRDARGRSEELE